MTTPSTHCKRLEWIDWMKAIGIYLMVLGHFFSVGNKFIYVFHVPLFFVISGFLCKKENEQSVFWEKLWYNLVVPMLIMVAVKFSITSINQSVDGSFELISFYWFFRNVLFGMVSGFGVLWFVYTLIILKIIFQFCSSKISFNVLVLVMLGFAYVYNHLDTSNYPFFLKEPNAIINVFTAYPFFALGIFLRDYKGIINDCTSWGILIFAMLCGFFLVYICDYHNSIVAMFRCDYGESILLFLLGGVAGSMMIFAVSKMMGRAYKYVAIISRGTIIILGYHTLLVDDLFKVLLPTSYLDILYAAAIVLFFVPVILLIEKYIPIMAGKYRVSKTIY